MTDKGFDVGALLQLQAQRDKVSSKIGAFIAERERLEAQPWALCAGGPDGLTEESSQDTEQGRAREAEEVEAQLLPRRAKTARRGSGAKSYRPCNPCGSRAAGMAVPP